ncbi:MAG TPA: hypothetical protein ENI37_00060 [Chloroflexi bacterium]|nr:hypothetical protein [Chloroflexota bacterium]
MPAITFDTAIVKSMMEDAIEFCARKTGLEGRDQVLEALGRGDCSVCEYLRYGLAKGVAEYLGSVDDTVKAIYTYEPEYATSVEGLIPDRPNLTPGINLIAWVSRKSAALSSVVASLNSGLAEECRRLVCPRANALCFMLDVKVADDDEVQRQTGYGALIRSLYVRPLEVWHR